MFILRVRRRFQQGIAVSLLRLELRLSTVNMRWNFDLSMELGIVDGTCRNQFQSVLRLYSHFEVTIFLQQLSVLYVEYLLNLRQQRLSHKQIEGHC